MKIPTHKELVADIEAYIDQNNMTPTIFGKKFLSDSGSVSRLKSGSDPRLSTVQKIYKIIDEDA